MKIFETVRKNYAILGVDSAQSIQNHPFNKKITMASLLIGLTTFFHIMHVLCVASNLKEQMQSITTSSGSLIISICIFTIIFKMQTVFDCINGFEDILAMRLKYPASAAAFDNTNQNIEKYGKILLFVASIFLNGVLSLHCIICYILYFLTDMGSNAFVLPIPMWFPFDTKNPLGFLLAFIFQYIHLAYETFFMSNLLILGVGAFSFAMTAIKDLKNILRSINIQCTESKTEEERIQALNQLREFVEMHSGLKQSVDMFTSISQPIALFTFAWSFAAVCTGLLVLQMAKMHNEWNVTTLGIASVDTCAATFIIFIGCELGQRITNAFEEILDEFDKFNWYRFPMKIQRLLPMIMAEAQLPVEIEVFGSITCCRYIMRTMVNTIYSYSMIFRKFIT